MVKENSAENLLQEVSEVGDEVEIRKEKIVNYFKKNKNWVFYLILAFITFIGVYIRTLNIPRLKDVATGTWTLGPDLDPFLFLRWAKYIIEHGSLMAHDAMRFVPLGYDTAVEMKLLSYMIAWFHNFLSLFGMSDSVTYSAIIFPVVMFALTTIAFFLFARKIFYMENKVIRNSIALLATLFFVLIPSLLPRTIAGIPEKESAAFFFMFMAFYFFIEAFTTKNFKRGILFGILAGIMTGLMTLIWGGVIFVFFTIPAAVFVGFIFKKVDFNKLLIYLSWLIVTFAFMILFSARYSLQGLVMSTSTGFA